MSDLAIITTVCLILAFGSFVLSIVMWGGVGRRIRAKRAGNTSFGFLILTGVFLVFASFASVFSLLQTYGG